MVYFKKKFSIFQMFSFLFSENGVAPVVQPTIVRAPKDRRKINQKVRIFNSFLHLHHI